MIVLHPESWYLFLALPVLAFMLFLGSRRALKNARGFGYAKGDPFFRRLMLVRFNKGLSFLLFYSLVVLALYDFHWGREPVSQDSKGLDIAIVMDMSYSMLAADSLPTRLDSGKENVLLLIQNLTNTRYTFIPFKGEPMTAVPLTEDKVMLEHYIHMAQPDWLSSPGSNIEKALLHGAKALDSEQDRNQVILLISDGEELTGSALRAARSLVNSGIHLVVLAAGQDQPLAVETSPGEWLSDNNGQRVMTSADLLLLQEITRIMDGSLMELSKPNIQKALLEDISSLAGPGLGIRYIRQQKYYLFLLPAVFLILLNQWIGRISWRKKS